ncbi:MAG: ABC transporter permease [Sphingobacteriia bacterium]|nr:MAG: ABC transporter permease [Sphingobacteriia bacterium]
MNNNQLYPIFLKLDQLSVLLVGAGNVGLEKLSSVLVNSPQANIIIVAPFVRPEIKELAAAHQNCIVEERIYLPDDLQHKHLVILATDDVELHKQIKTQAAEMKLLVNVADTPDLCDFYLGSIVQKGNLKIAISTNGKSPTAAKRIKEALQVSLPDELDDLLNNLQSIRNKLKGNFAYKVEEMNRITKPMMEHHVQKEEKRWKKIATYSIIAFAFMLVGHFIFSYLPLTAMMNDTISWYKTLGDNFHWMVLAGFLAQMVDGATSMGYGVTSAIVLMSANIHPAAISGSIHTAEMFASGVSGYSHYKFGNVNKKLFKVLVIPGVLGAILGAVLLVKFGETHIGYIRPIMACYTLFLGIKILIAAFGRQLVHKKFKQHRLLAGVGGFLDSFGGGGWGPIVTATLITKSRTSKYIVGSVSLTEFFVTLASAFTFFILLGVQHWQTIIALIVGSVVAAPIAARLNGKLPRKASFILLGFIVIAWSVKILVRLF